MIDDTEPELHPIRPILRAARAERVVERARSLFTDAIKLCDDAYGRTFNVKALAIKAQCYSELAIEESVPSARSRQWRRAFETLDGASSGARLHSLSEIYALIAVDCFQDQLSDFDTQARLHHLRAARHHVDDALRERTNDANTIAALLARKSSVIRHMALVEPSPIERVRRFQEAHRCASLALKNARTESILLELALCEWMLARHESTDASHVSRLRTAEQLLVDDATRDYEPTRITLTRFYRMNFQPVMACETFPRSTMSPRRAWRESNILAEAATQMWFAGYPDSTASRYVSEARSLLESALAAGYRNARTVLNLAYVTAILDGPDAGRVALSEICAGGTIAWDQAIRIAMAPNRSNLTEVGFALGIDQAAVWTRLGTFVLRFFDDRDLAEGLYRTATRLDPHDPIALTNLARFLVRHRGSDSHHEVRRLVQKAQTFADRRFTWWRAVLAELPKTDARAGQETPIRPTRSPGTDTFPDKFVDIKDVRRYFKHAERMTDTRKRGYALERLVFELADLTFGTATSGYRFQRPSGGESQVDGYFVRGSDRYRIECKWLSTPADHNDIVAFSDKLDVAGVGGLFVSMSGFTEGAIGRAREFRGQKVILLMDGSEARALFELQLNFDEVINQKRRHFDQRSEPYYVIVASEAA